MPVFADLTSKLTHLGFGVAPLAILKANQKGSGLSADIYQSDVGIVASTSGRSRAHP
jgi:hypothetical protein